MAVVLAAVTIVTVVPSASIAACCTSGLWCERSIDYVALDDHAVARIKKERSYSNLYEKVQFEKCFLRLFFLSFSLF